MNTKNTTKMQFSAERSTLHNMSHNHETYQDFNCSLSDLCLNGKSLKEGRLLWAKPCTLGRNCDINRCYGSSFGWCSNL